MTAPQLIGLAVIAAAALTFAPSVIDRAIRNHRRRQARAARLAFWDDVIEEALEWVEIEAVRVLSPGYTEDGA